MIQWFSVFTGANYFGSMAKKTSDVGAGAGARNFGCLELEPEPEPEI